MKDIRELRAVKDLRLEIKGSIKALESFGRTEFEELNVKNEGRLEVYQEVLEELNKIIENE